MHKIGANLYSKLPVAPFSCKKYGTGRVDGWMEGSKSRVKDCLQQQKIIENGLDKFVFMFFTSNQTGISGLKFKPVQISDIHCLSSQSVQLCI